MAKNGTGKSGSAKKAGKKRATKAAQVKKSRAKKTSAKKTSAKKTPAKKRPPAKKKPPKKPAKGARVLAEETWKEAHLARDDSGVLGVQIVGEGFKTLQQLADEQKKIRVIVSFAGAALMVDAQGLLDFIGSHAGTCDVDASTCATG